MTKPIAEAFAAQARACADLGSPFTARLLEGLPARLDRRTAFGARILGWPGDPRADALALRAAGALHALARTGRDPVLSAAWPPQAASDPAEAAAGAIARHDAWLAPWLDRPPQTNEVARAGALLGGLLILAARTGMEIDLLEVAASAGLVGLADRYRYALGDGRSWGEPKSPVRIESEWRGPVPPLEAPLRLASRAACDAAPLDPGRAEDRARLCAYVWADQTARLERLEAALALAAAGPERVEAADGGEWLERRLAQPQAEGRLRVVWHSIAWQYFSAESARRARAALEAAGAAASATRPLAWLWMEADGTPGSAALDLTLWPGGRTERLGRTDFHGRWTAWADEGLPAAPARA